VENLFTLKKLELYDNHIQKISHLENLTNLTILDLSFNSIRDISPVSACPLLQELYAAQNKLRKIEGLTGLQHLRTLDLGANRIRVSTRSLSIDGLGLIIFILHLFVHIYIYHSCVFIGNGRT